jgi:hypothetical protein
MGRNFNTSEKITLCLLSVLQKTLICFFEKFQTAIHSGKMYMPPSFSLWSITTHSQTNANEFLHSVNG